MVYTNTVIWMWHCPRIWQVLRPSPCLSLTLFLTSSRPTDGRTVSGSMTESILRAGMEANLPRSVRLSVRLSHSQLLPLVTASCLHSHTPRIKSSKNNTKSSMPHSTSSSPPSNHPTRVARCRLAFHPPPASSISRQNGFRNFWERRMQQYYLGQVLLIYGTTKPFVDIGITWSWLATLFEASNGLTRLPEICLMQICTVKKLCLWGVPR